jgi:hypothetical protein
VHCADNGLHKESVKVCEGGGERHTNFNGPNTTCSRFQKAIPLSNRNGASNQLQENFAMPRRPTPKTLESLHVTLHKLEQTENPVQNEESISELKRILLNRIADLELAKTLETTETEDEKAPEPNELVSPHTTEESASADFVDMEQLEKLN